MSIKITVLCEVGIILVAVKLQGDALARPDGGVSLADKAPL